MRTRFLLFAILLFTSLSAAAQAIQVTDGASTTPWLAAGATTTALVWQQGQSRINAAILDPLGNLVTQPFDIGSAPAYSPPQAAAVGDAFLVVWRDIDAADRSYVRGAIIDSSGVVQAPFTIATSTAANGISTVVVAGGAVRFIVGWADPSGARGAWVNTAGVIESTFPIGSNATVSSMVVRSEGAIAAWSQSDTRTDRLNIGLTVIAGSTPLRSSVIASMPAQGGFGTPYLLGPSIGFNGSGYYVAWVSGRTGREDIVEGTRLADDLTPLDVDPAQSDGHHAGATIISLDYGTMKGALRVSAAGPRFLVSWFQLQPITDKVKARYVESDGTPSTNVSFPLPVPTSAPYDLAASGTMAVLQNGTPIAAWTLNSGRLFVRVVGGAPRNRAARR